MRRFLILLLLGILLVACDQAAAPRPAGTPSAPTSGTTSQAISGATTPQAAGGATATGAYPAPDSAYPAPTDAQDANGYPAPGKEGPQFTLNTPVHASDTEVTGKGPAGVPVKLVNVARSGELIGETTIGNDGAFTVKVSAKLIAGDRIALMLGNTAGTKFNRDDFVRGPGYVDYPLIGVMFASTVIQ
jgi:hypothetical protein